MQKDSAYIPHVKLSPRETEVLTLTAQGKKRSEIAELLLISEVTVKDYVQAACIKLGATNKAQASVLALLFGLITPYRADGLIQNAVKLRKKAKKPLRTEGAPDLRDSLSPQLASVRKLNAPQKAA